MNIFVSHAEKNKNIALSLARFLENCHSCIEVFCSSENGSINIGENFAERIFSELNKCNLFIPILSEDYYKSRYCMIELGVAYAYLHQKYSKQEDQYIFPLALYPTTKGNALSGTPISFLQVGEINDSESIRNLLTTISDFGVEIGAGVNRNIRTFKEEIDRSILKVQDLISLCEPGAFFADDANIVYKKREDIAGYGVSTDGISLNFNMNPYESITPQRPKWISLALRFINSVDLARYLDFNDSATFQCTIESFTNSITKLSVEFKFSDSLRQIKQFPFSIKYGDNTLSIPLSDMRGDALRDITEICFVIRPEDIVEDEGMFKVKNVKIAGLPM